MDEFPARFYFAWDVLLRVLVLRFSQRTITMRWAFLILAFLGLSREMHAAGGPEKAVVVVNADSWASTLLANEHVQARGIPASHVIALTDLPGFDTIPVQELRQRILLALLEKAHDVSPSRSLLNGAVLAQSD